MSDTSWANIDRQLDELQSLSAIALGDVIGVVQDGVDYGRFTVLSVAPGKIKLAPFAGSGADEEPQLHGDGVRDDTAAIQARIDRASDL